jgi:hypothetical protein
VQQIVIDPASRGNPVDTARVNVLPPNVRKFGFVPDFSRCRPGDLILSFSVEPGFVERQIAQTQDRIGLGKEHTRWTHAAVFIYEDWILEAVPWKGVITRSVYSDIPDSVLRVRRCPGLVDEERYKIALCAQRMLGSRYDTAVVLSAGLKAQFSGWDRVWFPVARPTIACSKVFYDAHAEITQKLLQGCPLDDLVTPAHLSATQGLEDVHIPWLKVE